MQKIPVLLWGGAVGGFGCTDAAALDVIHRFGGSTTFVRRRLLKIGRRASRTACRRGASHDSRGYRASRPTDQNSFSGSSFSADICSRSARMWSPQ
ncbi:hypothetical protein F4W70_20220 [Pseudomonas cannabina]|nr:hypothetical protein F4W70_20220 [Pseudomonas cannabina]